MMKLIEKLATWLGFEKKREPKKIAYNADFELLNAKGIHHLEHFTGHISFDERTECDVEDATLDFCIGNPNYIDGTSAYRAPWSRGVNTIVWHGGVVKSGNLKCTSFEGGEFCGDTLVIVKNRLQGTFSGKKLVEEILF